MADVTKQEAVRVARRIVNRIIDDLSDRRGLRHEWEGIDEDIQEEIKARWTLIARRQIVEMLDVVSAEPAAPGETKEEA